MVGGHFSWGIWDELPQYVAASAAAAAAAGSGARARAAPPCLVVGRYPVDRVVSYYYHRCYDNPGCAGYQR